MDSPQAPDGPGRRRRIWGDASIQLKGLVVVSLPVVALLFSTGVVMVADSARADAEDRALVAEAIEGSVAHLREVSLEGNTIAYDYFVDPNPEALGALEQYRSDWAAAVTGIETVVSAQDDGTLRSDARALREAADQLTDVTDRLLENTDPSLTPDLLTEAGAYNLTLEEAIADIAVHAADLHRLRDADYAEKSAVTSRLIVLMAALGIIGGVAALLLVTRTIVRRIGRLEINARALGEGRPLDELRHSGDELGRLGLGLDRAARLLRDRERALERAAETLRLSEERLGLALESGSMGTWETDVATGACRWSVQTERQYGLAPGTFGGDLESWLAAVHPEDRAGALSVGSEASADGGRFSNEYRSVHPDGSTHWLETHGQSVHDETGKVVSLVGVSIDITERKAAEQAIRAALAEADRANSAKSDFLSRVSHELRTPLNAILGFGQLLRMDDLADLQRESVDQVLGAGRHLLSLIDDVLDISRIESDTLALSIEPIDIDEVLRETLALMRPVAEEHGVTLDAPGPTLGNVHVRADRRRLRQVLLNLASNGIKYNHRGGRVTFRQWMPTEGVVRIEVTDTGQGIPADRLERLFTPFDRLGAEQTEIDGTGIGLALSQRLAELMGATLTVESEVGRGSTFAVELALTDDPLASVGSAALERPTPDTHAAGGTILYVEDNPSNLRLVQRVLEQRDGIRLLSAQTGAMALAVAAEVPLDIVLLDLHLSDQSGEEVLAALRAAPATATTPVVIVSADVTPGQVERLRAAGADDYLAKPLDLDELLALLDRLLTGVAC